MTPLVACAAGLSIGLLATRGAEALARRRGALDLPEARRAHTVPTPRWGGLGVLAGALPALLLDAPLPVLVGALAFFAVGFVDDLAPGGLRARWKLALQAAVAVAVVGPLGLRLRDGGTGPFPDLALGPAEAVATILWIVGVVNVVNFMDGIDAISAATAVVVLSIVGASSDVAPSVATGAAGAVVGFSFWNASPARVFLGDGGSHLLGFLCAAAPCVAGAGGAPGAPWALVGAALLPSAIDVGEALVHKARVGVPLSQAHADHLYQRLVKAGRPPVAVALRYGLLAAACAACAGPVAARFGGTTAALAGAALLLAHLVEGARATRGVERLRPS